MSELAHNLHGEPFDVPSTVRGWRVRRMKQRGKGKGAPEVVYNDGVPLVLPVESDVEDLRNAVRGVEGKYRLDPVNDTDQVIAEVQSAYVFVEGEASLDPTSLNRPASDNAQIEAMRLNTELAKSIIERFPMVMESTAIILRAADGAGLPAREPRPLPVVQSDAHDTNDDADDEPSAEPAPKSSLIALVELLAPVVMPLVTQAIASGKLKIPGGVAALWDCRRAVPTERVHRQPPAAHHAHTPGGGPSPGRIDPATATGRTTAPYADSARRSVAPAAVVGVAMPAATSARAPGESSHGSTAIPTATAAMLSGAVPAHEREIRAATEATDDGPANEPGAEPGLELGPVVITESREELPILDAAALLHFAAIQQALTPRESVLARAIATELSPAELRAWIADLRPLSIPDAVTRVRSMLDQIERGATVGGVP